MRAVTFAFTALAFSACAPQAAPPAETAAGGRVTGDAYARGERLAQLNCATCHAVGWQDASRNPDAPPLRALSERYPGSLLADAFPERMRNGHPAMPAFHFDQDEIDALLAYLLTIQERQGV